jgi:hypothetical protein
MKPRDLRKYARQTNVQLTAGALLLFFIVGIGLIYWIWGQGAAVLGLICLIAGLAPLVLIFLAMGLMDWVVRRANRE